MSLNITNIYKNIFLQFIVKPRTLQAISAKGFFGKDNLFKICEYNQWIKIKRLF